MLFVLYLDPSTTKFVGILLSNGFLRFEFTFDFDIFVITFLCVFVKIQIGVNFQTMENAVQL